MKINAKYGIVAALTLAAFVAPSVGAYTSVDGSGKPNYTKAELKAIKDCTDSTTSSDIINTKIVLKTGETDKYVGVTHTIYADSTSVGTTGMTIDEAVKAVCVTDLEYKATIIDETAIATKQATLDAKEANVVKYYGGGSKNIAATKKTVSGTDVYDYEKTYTDDSNVAVNMTTGVYKYVGNYRGLIADKQKEIDDKKIDITGLKSALTLAQAAYDKSENPDTDKPTGSTETYTQVLNKAKNDVNAANVALKALEEEKTDLQKAGTTAIQERDEAKAALATAKAKNAKTLVEAAEQQLAAATTELNNLKEQKEDANTTAKKEEFQKEIDKQSKKIDAIKSKISALGGVASKAESEADKATEAAEESAKNSVSSASVSGVARAYTYTGKAIKPSVTVKASNGTALVAGTDYTVAYAANTKVGTATITITGKGNYSGTKTVKFYIDPAKSSIKKVSVGAKKMTVTVKKGKGASGVQIAYRVKGTKSWKYTTTSTSKTIKSLKKGKKYQVVVRSYTTKSGKVTNYSGWSATKTTAKIK